MPTLPFEDGSFPRQETTHVEPVLLTPPRLWIAGVIWQRDDEPDFVALTVEAHDGDDRLLALMNMTAPRDVEWASAQTVLRGHISRLFYELNSPF